MKEAAELWDSSKPYRRLEWMRLAGYTPQICAFAVYIDFKHLPTECQLKLDRTPAPPELPL